MNKTNKAFNDWEEIMLFNEGWRGLEAIEKLTGEKPALGMVIVKKRARDKWNAVQEKAEKFYKLPMQERLYRSGMATPPHLKRKKES